MGEGATLMRKGVLEELNIISGVRKKAYGNETPVRMEFGSLEIKLLNVPLPERKVACRALPLPCGYSSIHTLFAERVHALR